MKSKKFFRFHCHARTRRDVKGAWFDIAKTCFHYNKMRLIPSNGCTGMCFTSICRPPLTVTRSSCLVVLCTRCEVIGGRSHSAKGWYCPWHQIWFSWKKLYIVQESALSYTILVYFIVYTHSSKLARNYEMIPPKNLFDFWTPGFNFSKKCRKILFSNLYDTKIYQICIRKYKDSQWKYTCKFLFISV